MSFVLSHPERMNWSHPERSEEFVVVVSANRRLFTRISPAKSQQLTANGQQQRFL